MSWETLDTNLVRITHQEYGTIGRRLCICSLDALIRNVGGNSDVAKFVSCSWDWYSHSVPTRLGDLIAQDYDIVVITHITDFDESYYKLERIMEAFLDLGPHFLHMYSTVGRTGVLLEPHTGLIEDRIMPLIHEPLECLQYIGYSRTFAKNVEILMRSAKKFEGTVITIDPNTSFAVDSDDDNDEDGGPKYQRHPYSKPYYDPAVWLDEPAGNIQDVADAVAAAPIGRKVAVIIMGGRCSGRTTLIWLLQKTFGWPEAKQGELHAAGSSYSRPVVLIRGSLDCEEFAGPGTPVRLSGRHLIFVQMIIEPAMRRHFVIMAARQAWHRLHDLPTYVKKSALDIDPIMPDDAIYLKFIPIFRTSYERVTFLQASKN